MSSITYRKANQNDIQTLVDTRILFAVELKGEQPREIIDALKIQMTDYFIKATAANTCISFIGECDGKIAGIGSVILREQPGNLNNPSGKWGYIMNMYTLPEFRRKGICKGILKELIEEALKSGTTAFELHATKEGEFVYKQDGFKIHNEPTFRKYFS